MQDFRNLRVWQKAHELALLAYRITANFPREEAFGLRHSMRKTAVDIPAYVAEGAGKSNDAEFTSSINLSLSLAMRLDYFALVARDLELLDVGSYEEFSNSILEVRKMLGGFKKTLL